MQIKKTGPVQVWFCMSTVPNRLRLYLKLKKDRIPIFWPGFDPRLLGCPEGNSRQYSILSVCVCMIKNEGRIYFPVCVFALSSSHMYVSECVWCSVHALVCLGACWPDDDLVCCSSLSIAPTACFCCLFGQSLLSPYLDYKCHQVQIFNAGFRDKIQTPVLIRPVLHWLSYISASWGIVLLCGPG